MRTRKQRLSTRSIPALTLAGALAAVPAAQAQVVVQGFDATRDGHPNPIATLGLVSSPYFAAVRQAVTARYGDAVVFGTPTLPGGVSAVTADVLEGSDVFVVTGATVTLTAEEACLLTTFVEEGGAVLSVRSEWTLPTLLGVEIGTFGGNGRASVVDPTSPIIAGPFGTVGNTVLTGAATQFLASGAGWPVLADAGRAVVVTFGDETGHRGRAVLVGDEEIFLNGPVPFGASLRGTSPDNQLLFANIIDYLINAPGLDTGGVAALAACTDADRDGSNAQDDCDDASASVFPGATELLDGRDNDCDGQVDEGLDADGDGVPNLLDQCSDTPAASGVDADGCAVVCEQPEPEDPDQDGDGSPASVDCDDTDPAVHAGAVDWPGNAADEDCSGEAVCDPADDWRNHGKFASCVKRELVRLVSSGQIDIEDAMKWYHQVTRRDHDHDHHERRPGK